MTKMKFKARVTEGNRYYKKNQVVRGSFLKIEKNDVYLYDENYRRVCGFTVSTCEEQVKVKPESITVEKTKGEQQ